MSLQHENHQPHELTPAQQAAVERVLAAVSPAPPRIDRDRLMFLAGAASATATGPRPVASGRRQPPDRTEDALNDLPARGDPTGKLTLHARLLWPATSAVLGATSLVLAIALLIRPAPAEKIVVIEQQSGTAQDTLP